MPAIVELWHSRDPGVWDEALTFGTADQFVVKALQSLPDLPEASVLAKMKPDQLTLPGAAALIGIMRRKAAENNEVFRVSSWTPRRVDKDSAPAIASR